jgi:hypothetical protein
LKAKVHWKPQTWLITCTRCVCVCVCVWKYSAEPCSWENDWGIWGQFRICIFNCLPVILKNLPNLWNFEEALWAEAWNQIKQSSSLTCATVAMNHSELLWASVCSSVNCENWIQ